MKLLSALLLSLSFSLVACAPAAPPARAPEGVTERELDKNAAVASARADAAANFQIAAANAVAIRQGSFWVVELRAPERSVRYTISARDGSIRERGSIQ